MGSRVIRIVAVCLALLAGLAAGSASASAATRPDVMFPHHVMVMQDGTRMDMADMQFPAVGLVSEADKRRARRFLHRVRVAARRRFPSLAAAKRLKYRPGFRQAAIHDIGGLDFIHYDNNHYPHDGRVMDPRHPESLVYWKAPTGMPVLIGMMFRVSSLDRAPHPAGPLNRWHTHAACDPAREPGNRYQFTAPKDLCPSGVAHFGTTVMSHVWLTKDLRSAYALDIPDRALGILLPGRNDPPRASGHEHSHAAGAAGGAGGSAAAGSAGSAGSGEHAAVGVAWALSLLSPALALWLLTLRPGPAPRRLRLRVLAVVCLGGIAAAHAAHLMDNLRTDHGLAALFCVFILGACAATLLLALGSWARAPWIGALVLGVLSVLGYVLGGSASIPAIPLTVLLLAVSVWALARRREPEPSVVAGEAGLA